MWGGGGGGGGGGGACPPGRFGCTAVQYRRTNGLLSPLADKPCAAKHRRTVKIPRNFRKWHSKNSLAPVEKASYAFPALAPLLLLLRLLPQCLRVSQILIGLAPACAMRASMCACMRTAQVRECMCACMRVCYIRARVHERVRASALLHRRKLSRWWISFATASAPTAPSSVSAKLPRSTGPTGGSIGVHTRRGCTSDHPVASTTVEPKPRVAPAYLRSSSKSSTNVFRSRWIMASAMGRALGSNASEHAEGKPARGFWVLCRSETCLKARFIETFPA